MRIPAYYKSPLWQRFLVGAALGGIISWVIFFYMHSVAQERLIQKLHYLKEEMRDLEKENALWEEDYNKLNDKNQEKLRIQEIKVSIIYDPLLYKIDRLSLALAADKIEDDLNTLLMKDLETVYEARSLLKKSIENKMVEINKKKYRLEVTEIQYYTTLHIEVRLRQIK